MITVDALSQLLESATPHAVLDVRERGAYERGHIYRATSLPRRLLEFRLPALVSAPATPIVLYDDDGRLAELARPTVRAMGFDDIRVLAGGLAAWRAAGRPVVQGVNVPSKVFGERVLHELKTPQITPAALSQRLERGEDLLVVDARTPEEYGRGCVPGAISVPGGELVLRITDLLARPETTVVVHCGGRTRSYVGAESLRRMGLPNPVLALENGTMGWELAGLPLERGAAREAPAVSARSRAAAALVVKRVAAEEAIPFAAPDDLRRWQAARAAQNLYVFDVRTAEEFAAGHVAGATWLPGGQAVQAIDDQVAVWGAPIVLVCDGFVRAVMTASWLRRMGLREVAVLAGGLPAWMESGGAVEHGHVTTLPFGLEGARAAVTAVTPGPLGDAVVLSVDPSDAYRRAHVPGAAWVCRSRLEAVVAAHIADRTASIVVTCEDGLHSTLAAATLRRLGYGRAQVLEGGTRAWAAAGLPVERGPYRLIDEPDDVVLKPYERGREAMEAYLRWEEALDSHGQSPWALLR